MTTPPDTPSDPAAEHAAWAEGLLREQALMLKALAESGLRLAQAVERGVTEAEAADESHKAEASLAFTRVARAVRMTALLQARLIQDVGRIRSWEALTAGASHEAAQAEARQARARLDPAYAHKARVEAVVARVARAETDDEDRLERLACEAAERLDDDDIYGDVSVRPMGELVSLICRDLDLEPDWKRLGEEAWAMAEAQGGDPRSPFTRPLPLAEEGDPKGGEGMPPIVPPTAVRSASRWFDGDSS